MGDEVRRDRLTEVFIIMLKEYGFLFFMELDWLLPLACSCQTYIPFSDCLWCLLASMYIPLT